MGFASLRSIIPSKSDAVSAGAVSVNGRAIYLIRREPKVGTGDFQHHFSVDSARNDLEGGDRRSIEMRVDFFWILFKNNV